MKARAVIVAAVLLALFAGCDLLGALFPGEWAEVGMKGFSGADTDYVSVGIDEVNGIIYVAFQEGTGISVMKYEEFGTETWEYVGVPNITGNGATHVSLFVDGEDPYIAFSDNSPAVSGGLSVMTLNGTAWEYVPSAGGISPYGVSYNDILVENGAIYVAFRDSYTNDVFVSSYNGSAWEPYGLPTGFKNGSGGADFIEIERYGGTTYVSFTDNGTDVASVISSTGTDWSYVGGTASVSSGDGEYVSIGIDAGTIYAAFAEGVGNLSVMKFENGSWSYSGQSISSGLASELSMDILDGTPIVAYRDHSDNYKLSVQSLKRRSWEYVGDQPGLSDGQVTSVSLKAGNAAYYVAYSDSTASGAVTVLRYR